MRKLLILAIIVIFLYSSWAPVWGSAAATRGLVIYGMSRCWRPFQPGDASNRNPYNPCERYKPF
ncbi:hypothetical protein MON38_19960 [Hymenobacter sp. DH14]|uniref:Uncharacterized protein n=1 Tax=Hymenobacter cyanobacteriorum TaxID=2926463 RepID=A0A9X1VIB1_9BACT|nr:hypothetical protein [Hymenobacter cyanobacteriorum]MCI1189704.1 hypothetical protein [Hymenobacter cyanobacteriorum]